MAQKIVIDPVTRVEGHGRVTIHMDDAGQVTESRLHIVEFRGFERFIQGHPYWEVPALVQRLCGICPVSHHLAAAKAIDQLHGINPADLPPTATKLRRLLHYGQVFQSHALHFFYLASPDLLFGADAPVEKRNVVAVTGANKELARKGILMRKFGQEIIRAIAGKRIHGMAAVPGGMYKTFTAEERDSFLNGEKMPAVDTMIAWSQEMLEWMRDFHRQHYDWMDSFAVFPSGHLGLVGSGGALELYEGQMRAIDAEGRLTLPDVPASRYYDYFGEGVEEWTYLKFPYLKHLGRQRGWNRVGPLARINVCNHISTPLAEAERQQFVTAAGGRPNHGTLYYHWARLIETLHCAEVVRDLLLDKDILSEDLVKESELCCPEGIGVVEAPRGTLIHHYRADERGQLTWCNLIVSTTHNNEGMNQAVREVARQELNGKTEITDAMLNKVEVAIRAYDPCLSCATHALGQMPLRIELVDSKGEVMDVKVKE